MSSYKKVLISIDPETLQLLDSFAFSQGWSRSEAVRNLVKYGYDYPGLSEAVKALSELERFIVSRKSVKTAPVASESGLEVVPSAF